jgi:uncharacterized RDD family membrane protein YckC
MKERERVEVRTHLAAQPAGLVTRLAADAFDALVLGTMFFSLHFGLRALGAVMVVSPRFLFVLGDWIRWTASVFLIPTYHVLFWIYDGRTPGKWLLGIRVVTSKGGPIGPSRAILRFLAISVSIAPLLAGMWAIAFDKRRRAFHDRIAATLVVYDRARTAPQVRLRLARAGA